MPAYISSGTWSLMGLELPEPVISQLSFEDGFTNEIGLGGKVRFLKNICGLWLIQECRRAWLELGLDVPYGKMSSMAEKTEPFRSLINPDDPVFIEAGGMPERIQEYCKKTDQPVPERRGQIIRCIYESLALRYAQVWERLVSYTENTPEAIHIVGGGCQDKLLNQFTANALGVPVLASPVEATGLGNIMAQLMADGSITSLTEGREIVADSSLVDRYEPEDSEAWKNARATFDQLTRHS
jgi:sugar (pentulose or hexulose) kinase